MRSSTALVASLHTAAAVNIYATAFDGNVTTLSLTGSGENYTLSEVSKSQGCGTQPSWLVLDKPNELLYCMDENWGMNPEDPKAIFTSYKLEDSGKLTVSKSANLSTASSVGGAFFGDKYMAIAGYSGQVSALDTTSEDYKQIQILDFVNKTELGPGQASPHPHQITVDPTGQYLVVPDLGGDILRVLCWQAGHEKPLKEHASFKVAAGSGPRHVAFWKENPKSNSTDDVYLFLVTELASTLTTYKVNYKPDAEGGGLDFTEVNTQNTFGGVPMSLDVKASELQISPDNKFLTVSNRNDSSFSIDKYPVPGEAATNETEFSDSLATYEIGAGGALAFKQLWPAGGKFPRHFSMNKKGDLVAVGLQTSCRVVILKRDVETGVLGLPVADIPVGTCENLDAPPAEQVTWGPTCVVWDE